MIHTQTEIDNLVELAIIQRAELKKLVDSLPQLRDHLSSEIERNLEEIEPAIRSELEQLVIARAQDAHAQSSAALTAKLDELGKALEVTTAARYSVLMAEREQNATLLEKAEARIAEAASALPNAVKSIVTDELSRFPRAGEIEQLRKEFAEPRGLNPRGKWTPNDTYQKLDLVTFNGDSFVSNINDNRERPGRNATNWTLSAARGHGGGGPSVASIIDLIPAPSDGQILGSVGPNYVPKNLVAGANITINQTSTDITIIGNEGQIELTDGTEAAPSLFFVSDTNTGMYRPAADTVGIVGGGNDVVRLTGVASATDYVEIKNGTGVGNPLHVLAEGASANIGVHLQPKGSGLFTISDGTDFNKGIRFRSSSSAASAVTLIDAVSTAGRVVTLPDATDTLVGRATTDTLSNKTMIAPALGTPTALVGTNITGTAASFTAGMNLKIASNLSDLASASTARTNLGLGTLATQNGTVVQKHQIYTLGDSITAGVSLPPYQTRLQTLLGSAWQVNNNGVGGDTTAMMLARLQNECLARADAEYVIVLGGINDINLGFTAATIKTNLQSIYTATQAAGSKVVACTILPFKPYATWNAGTQAILEEVNAWILATATGIDYRVDTYTALLDPGVAYTFLPAYNSGDNLHPSAAGNVALANAIYAGSTFTVNGFTPNFALAGETVYITQNLRPTDAPTFAELALGRFPSLTRTLNIRPVVDEEAILIAQSNDAGSGWGIYADTAGAFNLRRYAASAFGSSIFSLNTTGVLSLTGGLISTGGTSGLKLRTTTYGGGAGSALEIAPDANTGTVGSTITAYGAGGTSFQQVTINGSSLRLQSGGSTIGTVSSTGLAITGLLSATGAISGTSGTFTGALSTSVGSGSALSASTTTYGGGTGSAIAIGTDASTGNVSSSLTSYNTGGATFGVLNLSGSSVLLKSNGSTIGTISSTGAAITGGVSVTTQFTSTVATGTAPLVVSSTTNVANLNASSLNGATFANPGAIGSTPGSGAFTSLSGNGLISYNGSGAGEFRFNSTSVGAVTHTIASYYNTGAAFADLQISCKDLIVLASGTERARVTSTGLVGIGTASPTAKLHVDSGTQKLVKTVTVNSSTQTIVTNSTEGVSGLCWIRDATVGGQALVLWDVSHGLTIVSQLGSIFTTSSPSATEIQLSVAGSSPYYVQAIAGATRNGDSLSISAINNQ